MSTNVGSSPALLFIDRDATNFHYILNYLRDDLLAEFPTDNLQVLRALLRECDFYCLLELAEHLTKLVADLESQITEQEKLQETIKTLENSLEAQKNSEAKKVKDMAAEHKDRMTNVETELKTAYQALSSARKMAFSSCAQRSVSLNYGGSEYNSGILWHLGTFFGNSPWVNPHSSGMVTCSASSVSSGCLLEDIVSNGSPKLRNFETENRYGSWIEISFNFGITVIPNCYAFTHIGMYHKPANWELLGKSKHGVWETITEHKEFSGWQGHGKWYEGPERWELKSTSKFSAFRIHATENSSGARHLMYILELSGFEVFGQLIFP